MLALDDFIVSGIGAIATLGWEIGWESGVPAFRFCDINAVTSPASPDASANVSPLDVVVEQRARVANPQESDSGSCC